MVPVPHSWPVSARLGWLVPVSPLLILAATVYPLRAVAQEEAPQWYLDEEVEAVTHRKATKRCDRVDSDGRSDWRLPTVDELRDLAARATAGNAEAQDLIAAVGDDAAWSRNISPSRLAWAAAFAHGYLFRIHETNEEGLRALCVARADPGAAPDEPAIDEGGWMHPLDTDTDSPLLWPCTGEQEPPEVVQGSLRRFRRSLPPGPMRETIPVDFVVDAEGRARFVAPTPETPDRFARLAVDTLRTFRYDPATCDGRPIPVFYHLDFGGGADS